MAEQFLIALHDDVKKVFGDKILEKFYPWQSECLRIKEVTSGRSNLIVAAGTRFCFFSFVLSSFPFLCKLWKIILGRHFIIELLI
jgi:hypothetical protein